MTTEALKSTAITGYDATPPTKPAGGAGAPQVLYEVSGYVTNTAGKTAGSTYALVRLRSDCYVKDVFFETAAVGGNAALDIGVYYSDNTLDFPTNPSLPGTVILDNLFASAIDPTSAIAITNETNQSGSYTIDKRQQPLWQAAGLSSDPGGYFDVVVTADGTMTNAALFGVSVRYCTV